MSQELCPGCKKMRDFTNTDAFKLAMSKGEFPRTTRRIPKCSGTPCPTAQIFADHRAGKPLDQSIAAFQQEFRKP